MILDPTDFLIYDLRLSDFYLSTNAFLNRKSQFINYKLIDSFIFNFQLSINIWYKDNQSYDCCCDSTYQYSACCNVFYLTGYRMPFRRY